MTAVVDEVVDSAGAVDNQKKIIGGRLKDARAGLKMTQKEMVLASGIPLPSLRDYEGGKRMPGGDAIASFLSVGINANWLLTGHGPMLWEDELEEAKRVRQAAIEPLNEARKKIVLHALARVRTRWFVTSPGDAGHALNPVVDDYNAGRIFQFDEIRDEIPSITVEELMQWGRDAMRQEPKVEYGPHPGSTVLPSMDKAAKELDDQFDALLLQGVIDFLFNWLDENQANIKRSKFGAVISVMYRTALSRGRVESHEMEQVLRLAA